MDRPELRRFLDFFCGCGSPTAAAEALYQVLEMAQRRGPDGYLAGALYDELPKLVPNSGVQYLLLYFIDSKGLLEHGSSILGSWLDEKGQAVFEALERERADDYRALFAMHCAHGYDVDDKSHDCSAYDREHPEQA